MANTTVTEPKPAPTAPSATFTELNVQQDKGKPHFIRLHDSVVKELEKYLKGATGESTGLLLGSVDAAENCTISVEGFEPAKIEDIVRAKGAPKVVGFYRSYSRAEFTPDDADRSLFQRSFPKDARLVLLVKPPKADVGTAMFFLGENGVLTSDRATVEFPFNLRELGAEDPSPATPAPAPAPVTAKPASITKPIVVAKPATPPAPTIKPVAPAPVFSVKPAAAPTPVVAPKPTNVPVAAPKPSVTAPPPAPKPASVAPVVASKPSAPVNAAPVAAVTNKPATPINAAPPAAPVVTNKPAASAVAAKPAPAPVVASKPVAPVAATGKPAGGGAFLKIAAAAVVVVGAGLGLNSMGVFNRQTPNPAVVDSSAPASREAEQTPREPESTRPSSTPKQETPKATPKSTVTEPTIKKPTPAVAAAVRAPAEVKPAPSAAPLERPPAVRSQAPAQTPPAADPKPTATAPPPPVREPVTETATPAATRPAPVTPPVQTAKPVTPPVQTAKPTVPEPARPSYTAPRAVRQVAPVMVDKVRQSLQGETAVKVRVFVDAAGKVTHIEGLSGGNPTTDALVITAINAVRRWQFEPARRGDEKVAGDLELSFTFRK